MSLSLVHRRMIILGALSAPLAAHPGGLSGFDADVGTSTPAFVPIDPSLGSRPQPWAADAKSLEKSSSLSTLTVVELPPDSGLPHARRHHALSIPFQGARNTVRQLGIDASECAIQLRMPTRVARQPVAGAGSAVEIQAHMRLACRFWP
jgi:hypothetical protein